MKIICELCQEKLEEPGALIFTPPDDKHFCKKIHLCYKCWERLKLLIPDNWKNN